MSINVNAISIIKFLNYFRSRIYNHRFLEPTQTHQQAMNQIDQTLNKVPKSHLKKLLNGYEVNHYFNRYIRSEYLLFISICINLISIIVYCQLTMLENNLRLWFLSAGFYFHFLCIILIFVNYRIFIDYKSTYQTHDKIGQRIKLFLKLFFVIIRPNPFFQGIEISFNLENQFQTHPLNDILSLVGLFQAFLVFAFIFNVSDFKTARSSRICRLYGVKATYLYVIKAWLKRNLLLRLLGVFGLWFTLCASAFRITEYQVNEKVSSIQNAVWMTFSTMFCIGFGDLVPMTNLGKWIALMSMYTGVLFTYISITLIKNFFDLNSRQHRTLAILSSLQKKNQLRLVASQFIRLTLWRVWRNKQRIKYQSGRYQTETIEEKHLKKRMKQLKITHKKFTGPASIFQEFRYNFDKTFGYLDNLKNNNDTITNSLGGILIK